MPAKHSWTTGRVHKWFFQWKRQLWPHLARIQKLRRWGRCPCCLYIQLHPLKTLITTFFYPRKDIWTAGAFMELLLSEQETASSYSVSFFLKWLVYLRTIISYKSCKADIYHCEITEKAAGCAPQQCLRFLPAGVSTRACRMSDREMIPTMLSASFTTTKRWTCQQGEESEIYLPDLKQTKPRKTNKETNKTPKVRQYEDK